ncbi:DciA family protein [Streptomyces sp. CB00072]|uniref:DciA family protein n=1 Tax=Streptomyces sp. CB00072 TaxID=1703928 RepID=UPI00093B937C|nr:DciA family protein [Streptomyces sp. CB00072]
MTETTSTSTSGVDLARVALRNARAAAKTAPQKTRRTGAAPSRRARSGEREPQTLGTAINRMMAERGLESRAAAGSVRRTVLSQWQHVAPELAGKVQAVRYDDATRTLHLRPCSPAYRTQLTLHQRQIVARVNAAAGPDTVACLKILPPGVPDTQGRPTQDPGLQAAPAPAARPTPDRPAGPRAKDPGYLAALTAHRQTWSGGREADPAVRATMERQIRDRLREPEQRFSEGCRARTERQAALDAAARSRSSDAARARALKKLADERVDTASSGPPG